MRLIAWDIESANLSADFGIVLCVGWKVVGSGVPHVIALPDFDRYRVAPWDERPLLEKISGVLLSADAWTTWFGTYFDIPFLNARLLYHRLPVLPPDFPHIDGWRTARNRLKLSSNRLKTVQSFLELPDEKTSIQGSRWIKALSGHQPSFQYIIDHCRKDVLVLEQAYQRLQPLVIDHPNRGLIDDGKCPICGSDHLQKRGVHLAKTRSYQRYQCQTCGAWSKDVHAIRKVGIRS